MSEESIFLEALGKPSSDARAAFLDQACAGDPDLRHSVEMLLQAHDQAGDFLQDCSHTRRQDTAPSGPELVGTAIGPYKLVQQIGEGGMGTVYMAQQTEPVRRLVALKLVKAGMDSREIIARFEAERQALALMDHPNIARVFDAGTSHSGRLYFVMELVKGVPLTKYCDQHRLTPTERLELFIPVCHAIQHAHQKGIIHRDIKPTNVLVALYDGKPVPKVIDFGVAKATGQQLTDHTLVTGFGAVVGTLEYMSPEQAELNQLDIDTRSDIYALGVLGYELLTGTTPIQRKRLREAAVLEALRIIREVEPQKPSTRLSTTAELPSIAANRKLEPNRLSGMVRGELDWIIMKALEKDRNRRYETASALAADVERFLHDEPVQACPPSAAYRLRKFARKYRALLRIAAAFVVFLVGAAAVSTWQAVTATRERDRAEASFRMARDAVDRLFTQVSQNPKMRAQPMEQFRRELLQYAKEFYERFIREQFDVPAIRYDLGLAHYRLAEIHRELGDYATAESSLMRSSAALQELVRAQPNVVQYQRDLAATYATLGLVFSDTAHWEKADASYQRALSLQEKLVATHADVPAYRYDLAKTYSALGLVYNKSDRPDSAAASCQQAQNLLSKLVLQYPQESEYKSLLGATQVNLGQVYLTRGWYEQAESVLKEAVRVYDELVRGQPGLPEYTQSLARSRALLGWSYRDSNQLEKAAEEQQQALRSFERLAQQHPDVLDYAYDVGRCQIELARNAERQGRQNDAVARYEKAIEILQGVLTRGFLAAGSALQNARINRLSALADLGDHARATEEAQVFARQSQGAVQLYNVACVFSRCSAAVDHDAQLAPADRDRLKAQYAERAVDYLRQAVAKGQRYPRQFKVDPDLEAVRGRHDFQKLIAELEAQGKE